MKTHTKKWTVYIIQAHDDTLYTGITTHIHRRFEEHLNQKKGARFFNLKKPREIVFTQSGHTRSSASQKEYEIKKLDKKQKMALINHYVTSKASQK